MIALLTPLLAVKLKISFKDFYLRRAVGFSLRGICGFPSFRFSE